MTSSLWSSTFFLHISWSIVNVNVSTHLTHSVSWFQQLCRWQFNLFSFNLGVVISSPRLWQKKLHPFKFKIPRALFPRAAAISFFFCPSHFCCRVHFLSLITRKSFIHLRYLIDTDNIEKFGQEVFFSCQYSFLLSIFPIFTHDTNFLFLLFMLIFLPIWCQFDLRVSNKRNCTLDCGINKHAHGISMEKMFIAVTSANSKNQWQPICSYNNIATGPLPYPLLYQIYLESVAVVLEKLIDPPNLAIQSWKQWEGSPSVYSHQETHLTKLTGSVECISMN